MRALVRAAIVPAIWLLLAASAAAGNCVRANFVVAIDVGHSTARPGATSARGATEYSFNRELAKDTLAELRARGFTASFIIEEQGADPSLSERPALAQEKGADLFLSIHHDSVQPRFLLPWSYQGHAEHYSDRFHGYSIFYSGKNRKAEASLEFCHMLGSALLANSLTPTLHHAATIPGENRDLVDSRAGIYRFDELVVLRTAQMPAALLEAGVIANRDEETRLRAPEYRQKVTSAVGTAVEQYCEDHDGRGPSFSVLPPGVDHGGRRSAFWFSPDHRLRRDADSLPFRECYRLIAPAASAGRPCEANRPDAASITDGPANLSPGEDSTDSKD